MAYTLSLTDPFLDTDGYWEYSVRFDYDKWASVYEYFFASKVDAEESKLKAESFGVSVEPTKMDSLKLERKDIVK